MGVISVRQEATEFSEETERIDGRDAVAGSQRYDRSAMDVAGRYPAPQQGHHLAPCMYGNDGFEFGRRCERVLQSPPF